MFSTACHFNKTLASFNSTEKLLNESAKIPKGKLQEVRSSMLVVSVERYIKVKLFSRRNSRLSPVTVFMKICPVEFREIPTNFAGGGDIGRISFTVTLATAAVGSGAIILNTP